MRVPSMVRSASAFADTQNELSKRNANMEVFAMPQPSAPHLRRRAQHVVGGGDDLGVDLIRALGADHAPHFLDDIYVRLLEGALHQRAATVRTGFASLR